MIKITIGILIFAICSVTSAWSSGWQDMKGEPIPETPYRKSCNGFGAILQFTDKEEEVFKKWEIPSLVFEMQTINKIERDKFITALIFFVGCAKDSKGNCNVIANYKVWQPDGKLYGEMPNTEVWVNKPAPSNATLGLAIQYMKIRIEPHEPLGKYTVTVDVLDSNQNIKLPLSSSFEVIEAKQ